MTEAFVLGVGTPTPLTGQNLLAQSLHELAYEHNPGFRGFIGKSGLQFCPHSEFNKSDLESRQELYRQLSNKSGGRIGLPRVRTVRWML